MHVISLKSIETPSQSHNTYKYVYVLTYICIVCIYMIICERNVCISFISDQYSLITDGRNENVVYRSIDFLP